jgi:hypothetical protein
MPFVFVTSRPPPSFLTELLLTERNVQMVHKDGIGGFLPALRAAFAAAYDERLKF